MIDFVPEIQSEAKAESITISTIKRQLSEVVLNGRCFAQTNTIIFGTSSCKS